MTVAGKMKQFAERSSWIRKMFAEGAKMKAQYGADNVFDFSLGNPDVPPPPRFFEVLRELAADDKPGAHGYMPNGGFPYVREALARRLSAEQEIDLDQGEVLMTCGAAGAINLVMKALLDPGDEVIILSPFFVEYEFYIDNHGGKSRIVATDNEFNLDLRGIEGALNEKTKIVLINSPNNPTGQIYSRESIQRLGRLLERFSEKLCSTIYLVADEPYRKIVYDGCEVPSVMAASRNSIIVSSYSKDLSLPGERIGYLAVHPEIKQKQQLLDVLTLANRILGFVNAPALMQRVVEQLQDVTVDTGVYARRRETFCAVLDAAGFAYTKPKGAFYIFPKVPGDDVEFCTILQQEKILAVPGRGFGAPGFIRLAFCVDDSVIERSADAFKRAMARARG
ncbi:MAG TPA: pyridoxal phosphate-dependent aminotransferase [Desulfobacteraceae bacterium]|nr:pyridoxal phosphate-dependent aminotransferase [Desulfobacteraceae bacterium]